MTDTRRIEVIANGLPFFGGRQLAIDTTVISALNGRGEARLEEPARALRTAKRTKETRYQELVNAERCHLVVFAFEVAGRWDGDVISFPKVLAHHKSQGGPHLLRRLAQFLFVQR